MSGKMRDVCTRARQIDNLAVGLSRIEGKLDNGINARIAWLTRIQWWQLGVMVTIIGMVIFGMWFFTTRTLSANDNLLKEVRALVSQGVVAHEQSMHGK